MRTRLPDLLLVLHMAPLPSIACIGAVYAGSELGLAADVLASRALQMAPLTVCTAIVAASHDRVSDLTEVPSDTVRSQLEHLTTVGQVEGARIGVLGSHQNAHAVLEWADSLSGPVVLEAIASGPSGETLLPARGIDALTSRLGIADLVLISRRDAELLSGGEIHSLDDAQVAAQRIVNRGARRVVVQCGVLPARFFDAAEDPGGDGATPEFSSDLYFDGEDFSLFERPPLQQITGTQSIYAITALKTLIEQRPLEHALQASTQESVESVRWAQETTGGDLRIAYNWRHLRAMSRP